MIKRLCTIALTILSLTVFGQSAGQYNVSIGANSSAIGNKSNIAIGAGAVVPSWFSNTVELGNGTATLNGAFHYMGTPIFTKEGIVIGGTVVTSEVVTGTAIGSIAAPLTNKVTSIMLVNTDVSGLILSNGNNVLIRHEIIGDPNTGSTTSAIIFDATSAIQGPRGNDGIGDIWVMGAYAVGKVTATGGSTIATYDGEVWITATKNATISDAAPTTGSAGDGIDWNLFVAKGQDGYNGTGLNLVPIFTAGMSLTTNDVFSYTGIGLLNPKLNLASAPAPIGSNLTNYYILVANGVNASQTNTVTYYLTWAGTWQAATAYSSNSVVRYGSSGQGGLYYTPVDMPYGGVFYTPSQSPWIRIVSDGIPGADGSDGANGIGNLLYYGHWLSRTSPYPVNVIVTHFEDSSGTLNLYVSLTNNISGSLQPDDPAAGPFWDKIITSGKDATVLTYTFYPTFSLSTGYSNALVRYNGKVYYTKTSLEISGVYPDSDPTKWGLFVQDGTTLSTNLVYRGEYSGAYTYCSNDMVAYSGSVYIVTNACVTNVLPTTSNNWFMIVSKGDTGATGATGPTGPVNNVYITNITYLTQNVFSVTNTYTNDSIVTSMLNSTNYLTGLVLQAVNSSSNFLSYSNNSGVVRRGYLTFTVTNVGAGVSDGGLTGLYANAAASNTNFITVSITDRTGYISFTVTNGIAGPAGAGLTNIILQPTIAPTNYLSYSNGLNNQGYITYVVSNTSASVADGGITNIVAQPVGSNVNFITFTLDTNRQAYATYTVTNMAAGIADGGITNIQSSAVNASSNFIAVSVTDQMGYVSFTLTNGVVTNISLFRTGAPSNFIALGRTGSQYYITYAMPTSGASAVEGALTNALSTNSFLTVYVTNSEIYIGFTNTPLFSVVQTAQVDSITGTSTVNGAITFTGSGVTQTGNVFNFSAGSGSEVDPVFYGWVTNDTLYIGSTGTYYVSILKTGTVSGANGILISEDIINDIAKVSIFAGDSVVADFIALPAGNQTYANFYYSANLLSNGTVVVNATGGTQIVNYRTATNLIVTYGSLTNVVSSNAFLKVYRTNNIAYLEFTNTPLFSVTQTGQVDSVTGTSTVNGALTFTGNAVTQTGTTFNFSTGSESDTLQSVVNRGASSTSSITLNNANILFTGEFNTNGTVNYIQFADTSRLYSAAIASVAITNETDPLYTASLGTNNVWVTGTTQTFDAIVASNIFLRGQSVYTNIFELWNYITNFPLTGITFSAKSASSNYVMLASISNLTAYVDYCVTNGGGGGGGGLSTTIVAFAENASVTLSNAVVVSILDNSYSTNETVTSTFTKLNEDCLDREDVRHTDFFIVNPSNGYLGGFGTYSVTNTRVVAGQIMKIGVDDYPIYSITNGGTGFSSVAISKYLPVGTTQTISGIYGIQETYANAAVSIAGGTNDIARVVGSFTTYSASNPRINAFDGYLTPYDLANEIFIVTRQSRMNDAATALPPEYESVFYNYNKKYFRAIGNTGIRTGTAVRDRRIKKYADNSYFFCNPSYLLTSIYKSTNVLSTYSGILVAASPTRYYHDVTANSDGSIIYVCSAGFTPYSLSGNGDYIYKSIDGGANWTTLTNMGTRYWTSVYTRDGTNLYAGTHGQGGTGYSATGGVYYSSDGGSNWILTNLRSSIYGANQSFYDITSTPSSNIAVSLGYNNSGATTNQGIWLANNNDTNFYKWSQFSYPAEIVFHPTDTNIFYEVRQYGSDPYGYGIYKNTNSLRQGDFITDTNELFRTRAADYRAVCFSPVNPNIGYVVYNRLNDSAGSGKILKTIDKGKSWTAVSPSDQYWTSVATYDGQTVYAAVSRNSAYNYPGNIYVSTNGGTGWTVVPLSYKPWTQLVMPTSNKVYGISKWVNSTAGGVSPFWQWDTTSNNITLYGGRYSWQSWWTYSYYVYFRNGILYLLSGDAGGGAAGGGTFVVSYDYGETWQDVAYGTQASFCSPISIAMTTGSVGYAGNVVSALANGGSFKTVNNWTNISGVDNTTSSQKRGVWTSDDGNIVYFSNYNGANRASTNGGSSWFIPATNVANWTGITSPDNGNTIIIARDNGTMGILTNALVNPLQTNISFIAGSPAAHWITSLSSNFIIGGSPSTASIVYSTNAGSTWVTKTISTPSTAYTIYSVAMDPRDTTSNSFWMGTSVGLYYTTNFFNSAYYWATNAYIQVLSRAGGFCIPPNNTNIISVAYEASTIQLSTNAAKLNSNFTPYFLSALSRNWTGITTYDGNTFYAAAGYYAETDGSDYLYKIDLANQLWSYLDNYRDRRWTDINTPNGIDIWATTRLELHTCDNDSRTPTNTFYSVITSCSAPDSKYWTNIKDTLATLSANDSLLGIETYISFSFDNNKSFLEWNGANWSAITTNDANQWKWWDGNNWSNAWTNTSVAALSDAMQNISNRTSYTQITGIPNSSWETALGFTTNFTTNVYIGVSMRTTNNAAIPNIQNFSFNIERSGTEFIKKDDSVDYQINLNTDNTQTIIKKSTGTTTAIINYMETP